MIPFLKYLFASSVLEALNGSAYSLQEYNQLQKCVASKQLKIYHLFNKIHTETTIILLTFKTGVAKDELKNKY